MECYHYRAIIQRRCILVRAGGRSRKGNRAVPRQEMGSERIRLNSLKVACRRGTPPGAEADKRHRPSLGEFLRELASLAADPKTSTRGRVRILSELDWLRSSPRSDVTDPRDVLKGMLHSLDPEVASEAQCRIIDHIEQSDAIDDFEASLRFDQLTKQFSLSSVAPQVGSDEPPSTASPSPVPQNQDEWIPVPRADWREEAAASQKPAPFLRPVAAARLAAIAALRRKAVESVQSVKPQTTHELEQCLSPAFSEYAIHLFDGMAAVKLKTIATARGRSKTYASWLKSKCLPAVVDDLCKPILGQFPITVRYVAETIGDVTWPKELVAMRSAAWRMHAEEVIPGAFTRNLEQRLSLTLQQERIPHWEATPMLTKGASENATTGVPTVDSNRPEPLDAREQSEELAGQHSAADIEMRRAEDREFASRTSIHDRSSVIDKARVLRNLPSAGPPKPPKVTPDIPLDGPKVRTPPRSKPALALRKKPAARGGRPGAMKINGDKVLELRGDRSQARFARPTGLSVDVIQRAEHGEATDRTITKLLKFAKSKSILLTAEDLKKTDR